MVNNKTPHRYKEKECPTCKVIHKKRGNYCSISCSNKNREVSENVRENMRKVSYEWKQTPEGLAASAIALQGHKAEDFAIDIPTLSDYNIPEGYDPAEDW